MIGPIVVERRIKATPRKIFEFLVESSAWAVWQGESCEIDARPGGIFKMVMPDGSTARGQFVELHPHTRVVFTWGWVDNPRVPPGSSIVTIDLEKGERGTLVRLEHRDLPDPAVPPHTEGWIYYLGRLATAATGGDPGPDTGEEGDGGK
jgi:uncharacterized protein YndB with AHSA1/START domain